MADGEHDEFASLALSLISPVSRVATTVVVPFTFAPIVLQRNGSIRLEERLKRN